MTKTIEEEIAEVFAAAATLWQVVNAPLNAMLKLRRLDRLQMDR